MPSRSINAPLAKRYRRGERRHRKPAIRAGANADRPILVSVRRGYGPGLGFQLWTRWTILAFYRAGTRFCARPGSRNCDFWEPDARDDSAGHAADSGAADARRRGAAGTCRPESLEAMTAVDISGNPAQGLSVQQPIDTTAAPIRNARSGRATHPRHAAAPGSRGDGGDYKNLVQEMPGSGVARVEVLPLSSRRPATPTFPAWSR